MTGAPLRVLCLDPDGGFGGSGRSLYFSLRHIDRGAIAPEVWCGREGPLVTRYRELQIPVHTAPHLTGFSAVTRLSRNFILLGRAFAADLRSLDFRRELAREAAQRFDLVHFNHEGLVFLARWFRRHGTRPSTMHFRKTLPDGPFARWQLRSAGTSVDRAIFITENEAERFRRVGGTTPGTVIYNIAEPPPAASGGRVARPFTIACLSSYSWQRGIDRLIDVAVVLAAMDRREVRFVVAGDMRLTRSLPGALGRIGRVGGTLADYAEHRGVRDMFTFLGHVADPERVLGACDMLAKPTREANPWGRDILEAMAAGVPALSIGTYDKFIEDGVTGILQGAFDPADLATRIIALADDPERRERMGGAARARVGDLCDGPARAGDLAAVWRDAAHAR